MTIESSARTIMERCDILGGFSEEPGRLTRRFATPPRCLAVGADADIVLVDLEYSEVLRAADLFYRHQHSPYVGRMLHGRVVRTLLRGKTVFERGKVAAEPMGRLIILSSL